MTESLQITERIENRIIELSASYGEPFYLYDTKSIHQNCSRFLSIPYPSKSIHFAMMSNSTPEFLGIIKEAGVKVFVNSTMHLELAMQLGFHGKDLVFAASAMDEPTMIQVKQSGAIVILDSIGQLNQWVSLFPDTGVGIRCNIGELVPPRKTLAGYFIGGKSRLGLSVKSIGALEGNPAICGLHVYAGTNITEINYFIECYKQITRLAGLFPGLQYLDFGGGFGIGEKTTKEFDIEKYGIRVSQLMNEVSEKAGRPIKLILEPGRIIGVNSGYFVCRVVDIKEQNKQQMIGVNASCVQFPRPLFYPDDAYHPVVILKENNSSDEKSGFPSSIYGCSTYSRDFLAKDVILPQASVGDVIVLGHAGSYCAAAHTDFLGFPKAKEYFL